MKHWVKVLVVLLISITSVFSISAFGQANIAGDYYASNFSNWAVPSGINGSTNWSSASQCVVTSEGVTFNAFQVGQKVTIVDSNPSLTETVTVSSFYTGISGCAITVNSVNQHTSYVITSASYGLQEAIRYAQGKRAVIHLTPEWYRAGATQSLVHQVVGSTSATLWDETASSSVPTTFAWNGSDYIEQTIGGGGGTPGGTNGAIQYNNNGAFGGVVINGLVGGNGTSAPAAATQAQVNNALAGGSTFTGIRKANGASSADTQAVAGTDYQLPINMLSISHQTDYVPFGDSITEGIGATTPSFGYAQIVADWFNGRFTNAGKGGDEAADMSIKVLADVPFSNYGIIPVFTFNIGMNETAFNGTTTPELTNYQSAYTASAAQVLIPNSDKVLAANCTKSGFTTIPSGVGANVGASASALNSTLTCTITTTVPNEALYFQWLGADSNASTASVSIDGSVVDNITTQGPGGIPINTPNGGHSAVWSSRYVISSAGSHTLLITVTSSSGTFSALWAGVANPSHLSAVQNARTGLVDILYQQGMANSTKTDAYNGVITSMYNQFVSDGFKVARIPTNTCVNNSLGMSGSNTVAPDGTFIPASTVPGLHPNDYGHRLLASCIMQNITPQSLPSRGAKYKQWYIQAGTFSAQPGDSLIYTNGGGTITLPTILANVREEHEIYNYDGSTAKTIAGPIVGGAYTLLPNQAITFTWDGGNWRPRIGPGNPLMAWQFIGAGRVADIGTTTLLTTSNILSASFELKANITCTAAIAGTETLTITYTDTSSTVQTYTLAPNCTTLGSSSTANSAAILRVKTNTDIQYGTTHTGTQPNYDLSLLLTQLTLN